MTTRSALALAAAAVLAAPAWAGSHLWVINEIFSSPDGSIQFIEMEECCGADNETQLQGKWVESESTGNQYLFHANLPPNSTANKHLLLATECFAALPGAPEPDCIIQEGFFDTAGDTLTYWFYPAATLVFGPGDLPFDGVTSLHQDGSTAVNSPMNFADETGSITAPCTPADLNADGVVGIADLLALLGAWGTSPGCPPDLDGSGTVAVGDLLELLADWGPC